ncbi:MAG: hypothetical protein GXY32_06065 [Ruminococcaceae bacterium]|nr:hypothetical protein [Oscillospiraceae bacterium]
MFNGIQMVFLLYTRNYIVYLLLQIGATLVGNIASCWYGRRKYHHLLEHQHKSLPKEEFRGLFSNIRDVFTYKVGSTILSSIDNIIISILLGTILIGSVTNQVMLIGYGFLFIRLVIDNLTASIGNLTVLENAAKKEKVFNELVFMSNWLAGVMGICLAVLIGPFIILWIGPEYAVSDSIVIVLVLGAYIMVVNQVVSLFRSSMGFLREARFAPLAAAVLNVALSVWLGQLWGLFGVYLATIIAYGCTVFVMDGILVVGRGLGKPAWGYFGRQFGYFFVSAGTYLLVWWLHGLLPLAGWGGWIIGAVFCFLLCNLVFFLVFGRTTAFRHLSTRLKELVGARFGKKGNGAGNHE